MPVFIEFVTTKYITKIPSAILATGIIIISLIVVQCGVILDTIVKNHREDFEHQLIIYQKLLK